MCSFLRRIGAARAAAASQQRVSFQRDLAKQITFGALAQRLSIRHANKLLAASSYAVALQHTSVAGAVLLAGALLCGSCLGSPRWHRRQALQRGAALSAGIVAAAWLLALHALSWAPVASRLPATALAALQVAGAAPMQACLLVAL